MNFTQLITNLRDLDDSLRSHVKQSANIRLTLRNWFVGAYIVEFEQNGEDRAEYGVKLIKALADSLAIKGLNARTLADCRLFHLEYPLILQTASAKLPSPQILQTVSDISERPDFATPSEELFQKLSFSHFVELLRLEDPHVLGEAIESQPQEVSL
ncbi:MAG: DUF1016 N-terminal domain-containing protein [Akkermansiaceae bacterium]